MKLSLSPSSIKGFFVNHIEKVVLVGVAVSLLVVCWNAFARDSLKTKPEDILKNVEIAEANLAKSTPTPVAPPRFPEWVGDKKRPVSSEPTLPFNPLVVEPKKDDDDPMMLAVKDLFVRTAVGPMAVRGGGVAPPGAGGGAAAPAAGEKDDDKAEKGAGVGVGVGVGEAGEDKKKPAKELAAVGRRIPLPQGMFGTFRPKAAGGYVGKRMVILTGLVPVEEQEREFQKAFSGKAPRTETWQRQPAYGFYRIARREDTPAGPGKWDENYVPWTTLRYLSTGAQDVRTFMREWSEPAPSVVSSRYRDELLTQPNPPMLLFDWGENASHPQIPLRSAELAALDRTRPVVPDKPVEQPTRPGGGFDPEKMLEPGGPGFERREGFQPDAPRRVPGRAIDAGRGRAVTGDGRGGEEDEEDRLAELNKQRVQHKLFRFFDFDVKPGHKYQYRVQVYIQNPNYGIPPKFLANNKQKRFRTSEWSKESPEISVPTDRRILGGPIAIGEDDGEETRALVIRWRNEQGTDIISEYAGKPHGSVLDKPVSAWAIDPLRREYVQVNSVDTDGMLVLDARGGKPVSGNARQRITPGEVLLLTPEGELIVRRQTEDASQFSKRTVAPAVPAVDKDEKGKKPDADKGIGVGVVGGGKKPPGRRPPKKAEPKRSVLD